MLKEGIKTKKGSWSLHDADRGINAGWMSSLVHILANAPSRVPLRFLIKGGAVLADLARRA